MNIKKYFLGNPIKYGSSTLTPTNPIQHSTLRNNSVFNPQVSNNPNIEVFKKLVLQDLDGLKLKKASDPIHLKKGMQSLKKRKDIVIRPADKGGGVVVLSKEQYNTELLRQLEDTETYTKLLGNPTSKYKEQLKQLIHLGVKGDILNKKESVFLLPEVCRIPIIYIIPKIHKDKVNPPGRPIVNGIDSLTARMGQYLDQFLQPVIQQTKAYLRDTKHVLQLLEEVPVVEGQTWIATADVSSLYTIVKHHQACSATKWLLRNYTMLICKQRKFLIKCLEFCLKSNYFWYNQSYYNQRTGIAMGAKFAPSVANAFMAQWEESVIYSNTPTQLVFYKRYIDDVLMVWKGTKETFENFCAELNINDQNINLVFNISDKSVNFLDLDITISTNKLITKTHFKSVDSNSYLSLNSCHHKSWLLNIPKGQLVRIKRNCTNNTDFLTQAEFIGARFKNKGYSDNFIDEQIQSVAGLDRNTMLQGNIKKQRDMMAPAIILDYNIQHKDVEKLIKRHWHILKEDRHLKSILPEKPNIVYKRAPTIKDILVKNVVDPPPKSGYTFFNTKGFVPCKYCYACKHSKGPQKKRTEFISTHTNECHIINDFISCHTEGVVYVLQCSCNLQYVGRTKRALMVRIKEHVVNIENGFPKHNVSRHFAEKHNKDPKQLMFWGIDKFNKPWRGAHLVRTISQKESQWIHSLNTLVPNGLNVEFDVNCFLSNF